MTDGTTIFTTAAFCARIAGLIAGTPIFIRCCPKKKPGIVRESGFVSPPIHRI
jgi:hypothetical protein